MHLIVLIHSFHWTSLWDSFFLVSHLWLYYLNAAHNASGYCSTLVTFKSIDVRKSKRRTVSLCWRSITFRFFFVVILLIFLLVCLFVFILLKIFPLLILLLCVLTTFSMVFGCQIIKRSSMRTRMFHRSLIYRKRMEQTEYLIHTI